MSNVGIAHAVVGVVASASETDCDDKEWQLDKEGRWMCSKLTTALFCK